MYDEIIATTPDGKFRARVTYMEGADNPRTDGDYHAAGVVTTYDGDYIKVADPAGDQRVSDAWNRLEYRYEWRDAEPMIERYIRILGGVAELDTPHDGPRTVWYVLPEKMRELGWEDERITPDEMRKVIEAERKEYRAWAEGEVYGVIIEKNVTWAKVEDPDETMETWEEEESVWGIIGDEWAEQEAREMLSHYTTTPEYVTGDGVKHATRDDAFAHAGKVAATTGQIIAIEKIGEDE
jgi:hypothetical protein